VKVPVTGDVPWTVAKFALDGNWLAERIRFGVDVEESVPVTANVKVEV
jgi:hypothetical protein